MLVLRVSSGHKGPRGRVKRWPNVMVMPCVWFLDTNTTSLSLVQIVGPASEEECSPGVNGSRG